MNPQLQTNEIKNTTEYTGPNIVMREMQERVLRVTEALYRTTDLFSDNEPLKWSLRESAVKILQALSALDENASLEDIRAVQRVGKNIRELLVKIELAASGTFMARKNFEVLQREYLALNDFITTATADSCFLSLGPTGNYGKKPVELDSSAPAKIADMLVFSLGEKEKIEEKAIGHIITTGQEQKEEKKRQISEMTKPMSERKDMILKFIQEKGSSGIRDVARSLEVGLSEKTIQRDLNTLVELGLLRKEGEKRWRRYFA